MRHIEFITAYCEMHNLNMMLIANSIDARDRMGLKYLVIILKKELNLNDFQIASLLGTKNVDKIERSVNYVDNAYAKAFQGKSKVKHKLMIVESRLETVNQEVAEFFSNDNWEDLVRQQNNLRRRRNNLRKVLRNLENGRPSHGYQETIREPIKWPYES